MIKHHVLYILWRLVSPAYTDEYKAYKHLGEGGYEHETVNHSEANVLPERTTKFIQTTASVWLCYSNDGKKVSWN